MSIPALVLHKLTTNHPARSGLWTSLRAHLARALGHELFHAQIAAQHAIDLGIE